MTQTDPQTRTPQGCESRLAKNLGDKSHVFFDDQILPVRNGDTARFLPTVLQSEDAQMTEARNVGGFGLIDREDAALFMGFVVLEFVVPSVVTGFAVT